MSYVKPMSVAPALAIPTLVQPDWDLHEQNPDTFTLLVFYRGVHCPLCKTYLSELEDSLDEFKDLGVEVIAVSGDTQERAAQAQEEWALPRLQIGFGQTIASMREWGLFISAAIKSQEPEQFGEPGVFLVRPNGQVYMVIVNSMPFARPQIKDLLGAVKFICKEQYPARGQV